MERFDGRMHDHSSVGHDFRSEAAFFFVHRLSLSSGISTRGGSSFPLRTVTSRVHFAQTETLGITPDDIRTSASARRPCAALAPFDWRRPYSPYFRVLSALQSMYALRLRVVRHRFEVKKRVGPYATPGCDVMRCAMRCAHETNKSDVRGQLQEPGDR